LHLAGAWFLIVAALPASAVVVNHVDVLRPAGGSRGSVIPVLSTNEDLMAVYLNDDVSISRCPRGQNDIRPQSADHGFIERLYAEHGPALLRYALGLTAGDSGRAEDLVQEAMLRTWRSAGNRTIRSPRSWLLSAVRNLAVDAHRARQSRPVEAGQSALDSLAVPDTAERTAESVDMAAALALLRPAHREALVETFYRGSSMTEAAATLGIPRGTVKSRTYYGLQALKFVLEERGITS
jgi:RNA polymerase sigma-70 factor (ECF subfamily)